MSRTIDEEIVKMSLDTKDFEKDIESSLGSIEKLKSSFNFDTVASGITQLGSNIAAIGSSIKTTVGSAVVSLGEGFSNARSGVLSFGSSVGSVASGIKDKLGDIASKAVSVGKEAGDGLVNGLMAVTKTVSTVASTLFSPIADIGKNAFGKFTEAADKELTGPALWVAKRFWENITDMGMNAAHQVWQSFSSITFDTVGQGFDKYGDILKSQKTIMAAGYDLEKVEEVLAKVQWYTDNTSYSLNDMTSNIGKFTAAGVDLDDAATAMIGIANAAARAGQGSAEAGRVMYNVSQSLGMGYMQLMDWKSIENANMATLEFKQTLIDAGVELGMLRDLGDGTYQTIEKGTVFEAKKLRETLSEKWLTSEVMLKAFSKYGSFVDDVYKLAGDGSMTVTDAVKKLEAEMGGMVETADGTVEKISQIVDKTAADSGYLQAAIEVVRGNYGNDMAERFRLLEEAGFDAQKVQDIVNQAFADGITSTQGMIDAYSDLIITVDEFNTVTGEGASSTEKLGVESFKAAQQAITFQKAMDMTKEAAGSAWASVFKIIFGDLDEATELWTKFAEALNDMLIKPVKNLESTLSKWKERGGRDDLFGGIAKGLSNLSSIFGAIKKGMDLVFPKQTIFKLLDFSHDVKRLMEYFAPTEKQLKKIADVSKAIFRMVDLGGKLLAHTWYWIRDTIDDFMYVVVRPVVDFLSTVIIALGNLSKALSGSKMVQVFVNRTLSYGIPNAIKRIDDAFKSFFGISVLEKLWWILGKVKDGIVYLRDAALKFLNDHNMFKNLSDAQKALVDIKMALNIGRLIDKMKAKINEFVKNLDDKFKASYGFSLIQKLKPLTELVGDAFEFAKKGVANFFKQIDATNIGTLVESIRKIFGGFSISSVAGSFGTFVIDWLRDLDTVKIADTIRKRVTAMYKALTIVFSDKWLKDPKAAVKAFVKYIQNYFGLLSDAFNAFKMWVIEHGDAIAEAITKAFNSVVNAAKGVFEKLVNIILAIVEVIAEGLPKDIAFSPTEYVNAIIDKIKAIDLTPVQALLGGIGAVLATPFVAISGVFNKIVETFRNFKGIDLSVFPNFLATVLSYKDQFVAWASGFFSTIVSSVTGGWNAFRDKIKSIGEAIKNGFSSFFTNISNMLNASIEWVKAFGTKIKNGFIDVTKQIGGAVSKVSNAVKGVGQKIKSVVDVIKSAIGMVLDAVMSFGVLKVKAQEEFEETTEIIEQGVDQFKGVVLSPMDQVKSVTEKLKSFDLGSVGEILAKIGNIVLTPFRAIRDAIKNLGETIKDLNWIDFSAFTEIVNNFKAYGEELSNSVSNFFTGIGPAISNGWNIIKNRFEEDWKKIVDAFKEFGTSIEGAFKAIGVIFEIIGKGFIEGFKTIGDDLKLVSESIAAAFKTFTDKLKEIFDKVKDFVNNTLGIRTLDDALLKLFTIKWLGAGKLLGKFQKTFDLLAKKFAKTDTKSINAFFENFGKINLSGSLTSNVSTALLGKEGEQAIVGTLNGVKDSLKAYQNELKAERIKDIATAVLVLAAGVAVLALLPKDKILVATGAIAGLFLTIALSTRFIKAVEALPTAGALMTIAGSIVVFALGIVLVVNALNSLKKVVGDGKTADPALAQALLLLAGIIGAMLGVMYAMSSLSKGAGSSMLAASASMMLLALSVYMLIPALLILKNFDTIEMIKSIGIIALAIIGLAVGLRAAAKPNVLKGAAAMLLAAVAIDALMIPILALTGVVAAGGGGHLAKGLLALVGAIAAVTVPLMLLSNNALGAMGVGVAFLLMAKSVDTLVNALLKAILAFVAFSALSDDVIKNGAKNLQTFIGYLPGIILSLSDTISAILLLIMSKAPEIAETLLAIIGSFFAILGGSFGEVILGPLIGIIWDISRHAEELASALSEVIVGILKGLDGWEIGHEASNLLVDFFFGFFGADRKVVDEMEDNFGKITNAIVQWLSDLFSGKWLTEDVPKIIGGAFEAIGNFIHDWWFGNEETGAKGVTGTLGDIGAFIVSHIGDGISNAVGKMKKGLDDIEGYIHDFWYGNEETGEKSISGKLTDIGVSILSWISDGLKNFGPLGEAMSWVIDQLIAYLKGTTVTDEKTVPEKLEEAGKGTMDSLASGIKANSGPPLREIKAVGSSMYHAINDEKEGLRHDMYNAGWNVMQGLTDGIVANKNTPISITEETAEEIMKQFCVPTKIESPSKVFAQYGRYLMEGLAIGINDEKSNPISSVAKVGETMVSVSAETFGQISDILDNVVDVNPTIRPSVDLTDVAAATGYMSSMFYDPTINPLAKSAGRGMLGSDIKIQNGGTDLTKVLESMAGLRGEFSNMSNRVSNLQVRMDTGALVGSIAEPLDTRLGSRLALTRRGVN